MPANIVLKLQQCVQHFCQLYFPQILKHMISETLVIINSRIVGNSIFPKLWQLLSSEILAIIVFLEMLVSKGSHYVFRKLKRMLAIIFSKRFANIIFRNASDKC